MNYQFLFLLLIASLKLTAQEIQPTDSLALLKVSVINAENKPQEGEVITFVSSKTQKSYTDTTHADGKFSLLIPKGQKYKVQYKAFTTNQDYKTLDIPAEEGLLTFDYTIKVQPPKIYTLNNVFFDTGKTTLRTDSYKELNQLAEFMTRKKSAVIEIAGHTDNVGTKEANQQLSQDRANTVRNYLLKKGIASERVIAKGYGDTQPIASNDTPEGKQKNRRTEVKIISQ
jgi:OmpA-OmpF porin, OOP family